MRALALTLLATALCSTAVLATRPPVVTLPAAFQGEWTTEPARCHADMPPYARWTVSEQGMITEEAGADILRVTPVGGSGSAVDAAMMLSGGGEEWPATARLTLGNDGMSLQIDDHGSDSGLPAFLWRCADPVPAAFLGEWARDRAECGKPYASIRLTRRGFEMPEVGEQTRSVSPAPGNPRELTMEAAVSIAGISYDERRVLRLSADGSRLDLVSLGQIERASEDPEWKPNPYATFRDPSDPERVETLLRCPAIAE